MPDGVLKRASDGRVYWQPNPAPPTWGNAAPQPAPGDWVDGFLEFYGLHPPDQASDTGKGKDCIFNGAATDVDAVGALAGAQAALANYSPSSSAFLAVQQRLDAERRTRKDQKETQDAGDIATRIANGLKDGSSIRDEIDALAAMEMGKLLNAIRALKAAGVLNDFDQRIGAKADGRIVAAIRSIVAPPFDSEWRAAMRALSDGDRDAILAQMPQEANDALDQTTDDPAKEKPKGGSLTVSVVFVPANTPTVIAGDPSAGRSPDQVQVQGQYEFEIVGSGPLKFSISPTLMASFSYDTAKKVVIGQPMAGAQGTLELFLENFVHLQVFIQMLAGATFEAGKGIGKTISVNSLGTAQGAAGVQAVFDLGQGKHLQLVVQGQGAITATKNQIVVNTSSGIGLQWAF